MGVLVVLGLVMICWANSARIWARRLAEAENRTPKVVYVQIPLRPKPWRGLGCLGRSRDWNAVAGREQLLRRRVGVIVTW